MHVRTYRYLIVDYGYQTQRDLNRMYAVDVLIVYRYILVDESLQLDDDECQCPLTGGVIMFIVVLTQCIINSKGPRASYKAKISFFIEGLY